MSSLTAADSASPETPSDAIPRPEHPRPDFMRDPWINLNGRWRFTFDPENIGEQRRWHRRTHPDIASSSATAAGPSTASSTTTAVIAPSLSDDPFSREIVVPFPWESKLSGIWEADYKGAAWYQRTLTVPEEWAEEQTDTEAAPASRRVRWKRKPYLCFGAVDWSAKVWVNGRLAGEHHGGYTPFSLDISSLVTPGLPATVTVRAYDACDADTLLGKQTYDWYTHSGGIWQTVWLEGRAPAYLTLIHATPHLEEERASFKIDILAEEAVMGQRCRLSVHSSDGAFETAAQTVTLEGPITIAELEVSIPNPRAWSPDDPHLYECTVRLEPEGGGTGDEVQTYFGLRTITREPWGDNPFEFVFLNGEPIYLRGALDQALTQDALHAYPSDDEIRGDIQLAKDLGLNMLRCHIKINDPRYYYWADKLGILMMYDLPSPGMYTPTSRARWEHALRAALARDYNHPSIFSWILFNETWGLEEHQMPPSWKWVAEMYDLTKSLDATRLVEDNSACLYDHVKTDLNTWHFYISDYDRARREISRVVRQTYEGSPFNYVSSRYSHVEGADAYKQGREPFLNSEYAGLGASGGDKDISYTFKFLTTELRRHAKVCGYVYTELSDIEWEHNGFVNYNRSKKGFGYGDQFPGMTVQDLTGADFVGLDCPPCQTLKPGGTFSAPAFVSHWDSRRLENARFRWRVTAVDHFGESCAVDEGEWPVDPSRFDVTEIGEVSVSLPKEPCLVTVAFWLENGDGTIRARNYVNVDVYDERSETGPESSLSGVALRFEPGDFTESTWPQPSLGPRASKFGAPGAGWVEYAVSLPENFDPKRVKRLRLRFEAGARTASSRIGWKTRRYGDVGNYPQTEEVGIPTDLRVFINETPLTEEPVRLPDDPADAKGVLSAHLSPRFEYASYGFLTTLETEDPATLERIFSAAEDGQLTVRFEVPRTGRAGGLNLYGSRMGAYPMDPTLFLETE